MINVLVADTSAVVRSVLKEIILKTRKLKWIGEAVSYDSLKTLSLELKPDFIITNKTLFDKERNSTLSEYCHTAEIPTLIYHAPGEKTYYSSNNINYQEIPDFISFSSEKLAEYTKYLEQLILDIKCSVLFENHPNSIVPAINEDGSIAAPLKAVPQEVKKRNYKAVLVGVSTGGPGALLEFLKGIGRHYPLPIFITQHINSFFDKNLIKWLTSESHVEVHLAENNTAAIPGHVYFAPSDVHLTFINHPEDGFRMILNHDAPVNFLRPSVDKMFESAASVFGPDCISVVLTGMGADGAKESLHLKNLGAYTIAQDEASSIVYGMPKATYEIGGACEVLPLSQIPQRLWEIGGDDLELI